jgi:hypothetical protein
MMKDRGLEFNFFKYTNVLHIFIGKGSDVKRGKCYTLVKCEKVPDVINYSEEFCNHFVILISMMIFLGCVM